MARRLRVELHPQAVTEAQEARRWYARRDPRAADALLAELDRAMELIAATPELARRGASRRRRRRRVVLRVVRWRSSGRRSGRRCADSNRNPGFGERRSLPRLPSLSTFHPGEAAPRRGGPTSRDLCPWSTRAGCATRRRTTRRRACPRSSGWRSVSRSQWSDALHVHHQLAREYRSLSKLRVPEGR